MTLPIEASAKEIAVISAALAVTAFCYYKIWRGRKVNQIQPENGWETDENNPANWYLKDPSKFLGINK